MMQVTEARLEPMQPCHIEAVQTVEALAHAHPWTCQQFADALNAGNQAQILSKDDVILGYFVAMPAVDEVHLLNITVAPAYQRQGWSRVLLDALAQWARGRGAVQVWLEVRVGNVRAQQVYAAYGFERVGLRKGYYPAEGGQREDALVLMLMLSRGARFDAT